ncbi:phage tail tape measure protein [Hoeflea sp. BAL378]|uniref:phage tail tape measure protein n=1 Tax=Hoeflea sp. BAL378 TaxID=1547437 RepID=UPI00069155C6|nr:phage tail tape measure protein [Hoeflea sp. BAL378]
MSNRVIEAIIRLSAKLGPMAAFGQLGSKLADVNNKASAFNKTQALVARSSNAATAALMRYAAPAALAYGAQRAVTDFARVERTLTRIGINADASREQMAKVRIELDQIAQATATPVDNIVGGLDSLIASGKSLGEAMALIRSVSATAQASGSDFGQMATTADAVAGSFNIAGDRMQEAFDILAMGGKAGKFELRDMAAELPSLAPAFAALGYEGEEGLKRLTAALQTVRMETGTSGEAATSFMDVISKMNSVTVSNNFAKQFGIDIREEMERAKAAGEDTLEAFIRLSKEAINGDMSKLPLLFTDKQMQIGMRALMNNTGEFTELLKELGSAAGTVDADLRRVLEDKQASIDRMANSWEKLKISLGETIAPPVAGAMDYVSGGLDRAAAINSALEQNGAAKGWWARTGWGVTSSDAEKDSMAWRGGYRSEEDRKIIGAYSVYGEMRDAALGTAVLNGPAPDRSMPAAGPLVTTRDGVTYAAAGSMQTGAAVPLPMTRPDPVDIAIERRDAERMALDTDMRREGISLLRGAPPVVAQSSDGVSARPEQSVNELQGLLSRLEQAGAESGSDLAKGGDDAADAIARAAPEAGNGFGDAAAAKINATAAQAGAAFGEAAAARIRAATSAIPSGGAQAPAVSGNRGRTMPSAGRVGAQ